LTAQEIELKKKNEIADKILNEVIEENTKAEGEKAIGKTSFTRNDN
jgi:dynein heavy chain